MDASRDPGTCRGSDARDWWLDGRTQPENDAVVELGGEAALDEGRWVHVTGRPLKLTFAIRTVVLERSSAARFSPPSRSEAQLTLETGELRAHIEPASATGQSWSFNAGPYRVLVIGTELHVGWNAETNLLSVHVVHGRARVRGGTLEPNGQLLGIG